MEAWLFLARSTGLCFILLFFHDCRRSFDANCEFSGGEWPPTALMDLNQLQDPC